MSSSPSVQFDSANALAFLTAASDSALDDLDFGAIGFDDTGVVRRYNQFESEAAGLSLSRVVGHALFTVVAPCMNNFLVAQRFEDAAVGGTALDEALPYVLTLRMRPTKVRLRLLAAPGASMRFVLVQRALQGIQA